MTKINKNISEMKVSDWFKPGLACMLSCSAMPDSCDSVNYTARQAPLSMGFSRQEYWSGCHFLLQGIFPNHTLNRLCCTGKWILYHWATWETLRHVQLTIKKSTIGLWFYWNSILLGFALPHKTLNVMVSEVPYKILLVKKKCTFILN